MNSSLAILMASLTCVAAACGSESDHTHTATGGAASGATCTSTSTLTYASFGRPFMEAYCTRCHSSALAGTARNGAPEAHDFDTLNGILHVVAHVDEKAAAGPAAANGLMPPSDPKPSLEERLRLGEWLACESKQPPPDAGHGHD